MLLDPEYGLRQQKHWIKAVFFLPMKKQVMIHQVQNVCLTAWMFGLQNVSKEQGADAVKFLLYYDVSLR